MAKSSVSALHEFCAKNNIEAPEFEYIDADDGFTCRATIGDETADGTGRSKRDAKHLAASNILKTLKIETPTVEQMVLPTTDTFAALRDFCIQNDYPLPSMDIVQQGGTPDAPLFVARCVVSSVTRFGESEKKKDAKQKAALEVLNMISSTYVPEMKQQLVSLDDKTAELECERRVKFRTYREYSNSRTDVYQPTRLLDRHYYFKKYKPELKENALGIIGSNDYGEDYERQALDILSALKLNFKSTKQKTLNSIHPTYFIELDSDYDACFAGIYPEVYKEIVEYFHSMLL